MSEAVRDDTADTSKWIEIQPGSSHIRVKHTDGNNEAFLVQRDGLPAEIGRLNGIVFQDFCIDGVEDSKPYVEGNHKIGISVQSDNDSFRFEGMGFVYLTQAMVVKGADACSFTNNFVAECGTSISLTGASQVAKITNNYLISAWAGYSVFAENAEGILISGNTILWACNITLINSNRCNISANKLLSNFPSMIALTNGSSENLISGNHFRRVYGDGTSTRYDDLFGLVHINGSDNAVTGNQFSFSVPAANITPSGADPTLILVAGGARNFLATNNISSNLGVKVVLDSSSAKTKILYSAESSQLQSYTDDYALVATP
jgi:inulin fructotransferase (DFA-I-forming)